MDLEAEVDIDTIIYIDFKRAKFWIQQKKHILNWILNHIGWWNLMLFVIFWHFLESDLIVVMHMKWELVFSLRKTMK